MNEMCPHEKVEGAVCLDCMANGWPSANRNGDIAVVEYEQPPRAFSSPIPEGLPVRTQLSPLKDSGLSASYYHTPFGDVEDMAEWLELGGANWCVLNQFKSIWREFNPDAKKKTTAIYEAEKRYYYAERDLCRVRSQGASGEGCLPDVEEGLETTPKTG